MVIQEKKHKKANYTLKEKFAESIAPGQSNELANKFSDEKVSNNEQVSTELSTEI